MIGGRDIYLRKLSKITSDTQLEILIIRVGMEDLLTPADILFSHNHHGGVLGNLIRLHRLQRDLQLRLLFYFFLSMGQI